MVESVTEMRMREKGKADDLDRVRQENNQLRAVRHLLWSGEKGPVLLC
jgi:hypothetical protein